MSNKLSCEYCGSSIPLSARFTGKCPSCDGNIPSEVIWSLVELSADITFVRPRPYVSIRELQSIISESEASYRSALRSPARGLWSGVIDYDTFWDQFSGVIRNGLTAAWYEGAKRGGILPGELTEDELIQLQNVIFTQFGRISPLADFILENSRDNGGKLSAIYARLELWVQAYVSTVNRAEAMANGNRKKMWKYGDTDHCDTCRALNGKVKRLSYWLAHVMPRSAPNDKLECGGWKCGCDLVDTDKPISRGPLPGGL